MKSCVFVPSSENRKMGDTLTFFRVIAMVLFGYQEDIQDSSAALHYSSVVTPGSRVSNEDILSKDFFL